MIELVEMARPATAQFESIDFSALLFREPAELCKLLTACQGDGFFYLDLSGTGTQKFLSDWRSSLALMAQWFDQPLHKKVEYNHGTLLHGYEAVGNYAGAREHTRDRNETFKLIDYYMNTEPERLPDVVQENMDVFERYITTANSITRELLSCLSDTLGLEEEDRLETSHTGDELANSSLEFLHHPRAATHERHFGHKTYTDTGTLSLFLTEHLGLEVFSQRTNAWEVVVPKPNYAVINVGDTLRFLSGQQFQSSIHRFVPRFDQEQKQHYSVGYFLRPGGCAVFQSSEGDLGNTSGSGGDALFQGSEGDLGDTSEWQHWRSSYKKLDHGFQAQSSMFLGGTEIEASA